MKYNSSEIFGGEVQYFRTDPQYWQPIIDRVVESGLKGISTYVQWNTHMVERPSKEHPAGLMDFEGRTDARKNLLKFLDIVQEAGLLMNFRCGPFCCNEAVYGGYPKFLVCDHPEWMVWNSKDVPTQGYWIAREEGMQPSYLHPEYLSYCREWLTEVDQVIRPRLRSNGGFIDMINLDNEISYIVKDSFLDSDYNPVNVAPGGYWHQFLTEKYGSAARMPYSQTFSSIDLVPVPRVVPADITENLAWYLDWVEFKEWVMCRYIAELRQMHVDNGVEDVIFMTNLNPHLPEGVPTRIPSFEKAVQAGTGRGLVGYDFYRGLFLGWSGYSSMARVLKLMNASIDYTWSSEFMAGTWNKDLSKRGRVSDDHMRFMARCALANGCKSIAWFMFHDRLIWGDAPVSSHGHARPSLEVLKETAALCSREIPAWDELVPLHDCAVSYDITAHRHTSVGDPSPCNDGQLHVGLPTIAGIEAGAASREYAGLFRVVEAGGYQAAVIDILAKPEFLDKYRLVFAPGGAVMSCLVAEKLERWCRAGGTLIVSGPCPSFNERGEPLPFFAEVPREAGTYPVGAGQLVFTDWLALDEPEMESLHSLAKVKEYFNLAEVIPHVHIKPTKDIVSWEDWNRDRAVDNSASMVKGDGSDNIGLYKQPRTLACAVIHRGGGDAILFVLNFFPDAVEFILQFGADRPLRLVCLDSGREISVSNHGTAIVDIDRKCGSIYRLVNDEKASDRVPCVADSVSSAGTTRPVKKRG